MLGSRLRLLTRNLNKGFNLIPRAVRYTTVAGFFGMDVKKVREKFVERSLLVCPIQQHKEDIVNRPDLEAGCWVIPGPGKDEYGGEDSYLMTNESVFGVFDGVGGWISSGVNPREYSYKLMEGCKEAVLEKNLRDPLKVLEYGYMYARSITGSSTACVMSIQGPQVQAVNLGDSGFLLLRSSDEGYEIFAKSKEQQHYFNCPFQLGGNRGSEDRPAHGDRYNFELQQNDIVVLGTDGLWDNLFDKDVLALVHEHNEESSQKLAEIIAEKTLKTSTNQAIATPFSTHAMAQGQYYKGGKPDDITVLVIKYKGSKAKL